MKYVSITAVALGLFLTLPALQARADDQGSPSMDHKGSGHGDWDTGKMKAKLGLTDDQAAKLKALHESGKETVKPLMEKEKGLIAKLNDQVTNKASDADIQNTLNDLKANRTALREQMEKMQDQKAAILTPTQQAKMVLARGRMFKHRHGKEDEMGGR